jgi:N-acetylmuramoyl-L-alanine amidase
MKKIVFLDPGHGGADPGALGPSGLKESDMALDVCQRAQKLLCDVVDCRLTRNDDTFISLSGRPAMANKAGADVFVSYHFNAATSKGTANSWEIFTTRGQNRSDKLASFIGEEHAKLFPEQTKRTDYSDGDIDKEANFAVIRGTDHPACLMEGEFIHTYHGEKLIKDPAKRQKMALAVSLGVRRFLGIKVTHQPSPAEVPDDQILTLKERVSRLESIVL